MPLSDQERDPQGTPSPAAAGAPGHDQRCIACGGGALGRDTVKTAFFEHDRLVVIEDVPALVCQACGERYYEDKTAMILDQMRGAGFPEDEAVRRITVPVFSFDAEGGGDGDKD